MYTYYLIVGRGISRQIIDTVRANSEQEAKRMFAEHKALYIIKKASGF